MKPKVLNQNRYVNSFVVLILLVFSWQTALALEVKSLENQSSKAKQWQWTCDLAGKTLDFPAYQKAQEVLLKPSEEIESPWNLVLTSFPLEEQGLSKTQDRVRKTLQKHLNQVTTTIVLLDSNEERGFRPEGGESLEENWVFSLVIPGLSDHIFWIVVPKDETAKEPYIYGFN